MRISHRWITLTAARAAVKKKIYSHRVHILKDKEISNTFKDKIQQNLSKIFAVMVDLQMYIANSSDDEYR